MRLSTPRVVVAPSGGAPLDRTLPVGNLEEVAVPSVLFRALALSPEQLDEYVVGRTFVWPTFVACCIEAPALWQQYTLFAVRPLPGQTLIAVGAFSQYPVEGEVLLPPCCRYIVTGVLQSSLTVVMVDVTDQPW